MSLAKDDPRKRARRTFLRAGGTPLPSRALQTATLLAATLGQIASASTQGAPVHLVSQRPATITKAAPGVILVDFGRVAFGNVRLSPPPGAGQTITVHFGEALANGRINRKPPGTVRYAVGKAELDGAKSIVVAPPADKRNTEDKSPRHPPAVLTPTEWGVVLPFRWIEIEGWPGELRPQQVERQAAFSATWNDDAASFRCSDDMLNRIWELCRYSIKATTFAGVYVDGDRERIPYEADAYLNQISHYATDDDVQMARDTFDWLMRHPTWPTEWGPHMVFMAYADWMHTGDKAWLAPRYESLKTKLLLERARPDGLVASTPQQIKKGDIVDWPRTERDGYVFKSVNTVVNAFHLRVLTLMSDMARALGHDDDATAYAARESATRALFQKTLFDPSRGVYRDGVDTDHASQHASLFPLAFGLVPDAQRAGVAEWLGTRGMACSVYAAQYLLEALFDNGADGKALELITAPTDRSWRHMVESGTTISWEAWDQRYKPNQDWNHAWGAAPANLLPRFVLGARPLTPGWRRAWIRPNCGSLAYARGRVPTPRGPIEISWQRTPAFKIDVALPKGVSAKVELPAFANTQSVVLNGTPVLTHRAGSRWILDADVSGKARIEVK